MPHRYQQTQSGQWRCPPGEAYAMQWGLEYCIRTETEIDWQLQRNLYFLEDYYRDKNESESLLPNQQKIIGLVESQPGITLLKLLPWELNPDEIYSLIATKQLYVDLSAADLANEPEKVQLFLSVESAKCDIQLSQSRNLNDKKPIISQGSIEATIGSQIVWDGVDWLVLNLGSTEATLLNSQQKLLNLPIAVLEKKCL
jgi:putative transposase